MQIVATDTATISIEFKGPEGELVVPVAASFNYTVTRLDGTVVLATQTPTLGASDTAATIALSSPTTDKVGTEDFEILVLKYQYQNSAGVVHERVNIKVVDDYKYIVKKSDVRNVVGASEIILADEYIDLFQSYLELKNSDALGAAVLDDELTNGGYRAAVANNLILYYTACSIVDAMMLGLIKTHTEDNISVTHFEPNLDALKYRLKGRFDEALGILNPEAMTAINAGQEVFIVATPTDPVTGA